MSVCYLGGHHSISRGGGGFFVADKLFISTRLGGALKNSNFVTCLYRTVLEVNYLFHAGSPRNYLFQNKKNSSPPPGNGMVAPLDFTSATQPQVSKSSITLNLHSEIFLHKPWRPKGYFQFEIIINVLVSSFRFI